jgi:hypothetical protein
MSNDTTNQKEKRMHDFGFFRGKGIFLLCSGRPCLPFSLSFNLIGNPNKTVII